MRIDRIKFVSEMMKRDLTQCKLAEIRLRNDVRKTFGKSEETQIIKANQ